MESGKRYSVWPHWVDASWASLPLVRGFCRFSISGRIHGQVDQRSQTYFGSWFQFMIALLCAFLAWNEAEHPGREHVVEHVVRKQRENGVGRLRQDTPVNSHFLQLCLPPSPKPFSTQQPVKLNPSVVRWGQNPHDPAIPEASCLNPTAPGTKPLTQPLGDRSDHNWA